MSIKIDNNNINKIRDSVIGLNKLDSNLNNIFQTHLDNIMSKNTNVQLDFTNEDYQNYGVLLCKKLWWDAKSSNNSTLMMSAHTQADQFRSIGATIGAEEKTFVDSIPISKVTTEPYNSLNNPYNSNIIISEAQKYKDIPYVFGGNDVNSGIDCSYFVQSVFKKIGINLPRTTYDQINLGQNVDINNLQPGDVVFFNTNSSVPGPDHVGIYEGNGKMIHASSTAGKVVQTDFNNYIKYVDFYSARRYTS